jgi:trk system potassium uptake protein TrkA
MKIIVIGYGRMGSQFVKKMDIEGNEVVVVDKELATMNRTERPRDIKFLVGNAIDEDLLREAGIEGADVVLALTRDENTNLMIAQIARVVFNVPKVIAVVYDPQREESFHELGIETLPISLAAAEILKGHLGGSAAGSPGPTWQIPPMQPSARVPLRTLEAQDGSFYVLIVGGGLVGYYLARALLQNGHEATIIERNPDIYEIVSQQIDCPVLLGDGSTTSMLERAGASRANVLCAVTNHDQDNLIACQMAKFRFGVPKTVARVKNPKNELVMRRLGVDTTVSSTAIMTNVIEGELPTSPVLTLASLGSCGAAIQEYRLKQHSPAIGSNAQKLKLPPQCWLFGIVRGGELMTSMDSTVFESGDTILAVVQQTEEAAVRKALLG